MNKAELINQLADVLSGGTHTVPPGPQAKVLATAAVDGVFDIITEQLKTGGEVQIVGFGAFAVRLRKGRLGINPQNPTQRIEVPSVRVPKFKAGSTLKKIIKDTTT